MTTSAAAGSDVDAPASAPATSSAADATNRALLALVAVGAAVVLQRSWATVRPPFDAGLALVIVVGAVHGVLGWLPPLRLPARLGPRSYATYGAVLALYLLATPDREGGDPAAVLGTRLACGVLVGVVVHRVLEDPVRRRAALPRWPGMAVLALLPGLLGAAVLAASGLPTTVPSRPDGVELAVGGDAPPADLSVLPAIDDPVDGAPAAEGAPVAMADAAPSAAPASGAARPTATTATARTAGTSAPAASGPTTTVALRRPVKILVAGESTATATGGGMRTWGTGNGRAQVEVTGTEGCALQQDGDAYWRDGWAQNKNPGCLRLIDTTLDAARRFQPDALVLFIGSNQLSDWVLPGATTPTHIGEPAFDQLYVNAVTAALGRLAGLGIPILFTTTPVPNVPVRGDGPGSGPFKMNDAGRTGHLNHLSAGAVRGQPLAAMAPYAERISNPDGTVPSSLRPDGLHLRQNLVPGIMDRGLEADLRGAYQQVTARVPSSARGAAHHWSKA